MPGDAQGVTVPLSTLGGLVTEPTPPDCPEGVSPDCQDVVFLPGSVSQRPCLSKIFASAFSGNPTTVYEKSYVQPDESVMNLYLDSANRLWKESPVGSAASLIEAIAEPAGSIKAGLSCTAFGREYIAFSDGTHGAHVPLQWDGTHLDRVTQSGPGGPVVVGDELAVYDVVASPSGLLRRTSAYAITAATESGTIATITIPGLASSPTLLSRFQVGSAVTVAGVGVGGYNGNFAITKIDPVNESIQYAAASGLATSSGGTATLYYIEVDITAVQYIPVGSSITITGAGVAGYNTTYTVLDEVNASTGITSTMFVQCKLSQIALAASGGGTLKVNGSIGVGAHGVVLMFLTRQGYLTAPGPSVTWTAAGGNRAIVNNLAIGPSNVVARVLAFTGAGGANYFTILSTLTLPPSPGNLNPIRIPATVVFDNTSTSATIDFSDTALFGATAIDIAGRNQFAQVVLESAAGFFSYASRVFPWGERNNIKNLMNMGFEGGWYSGTPNAPLGWAITNPGNVSIISGGAWPSGNAVRFNGVTAVLAQSAYLDALGIPIAQPNTRYKIRFWAKASGVISSGNNLDFALSGDFGNTVIAAVPFSLINSSQGAFLEANLTNAFGDRTPNNMHGQQLIITCESTGGPTLDLDEISLIDRDNPYRDTLFRGSYINAPEQFDGVTGVLGSTSDTTPIRNCIQLRNTMYFNTAAGKNFTTDNGTGEPSTWSVSGVSQSVGSASLHGSDPGRLGTGESGEQWEFSISENGLYIFAGSGTDKISQEIQLPCENGKPGWNSINKAALSTAWVKNDLTNRRCCIGVPVGSATAPNVIFVLDYRDLGVPSEIADKPPFRISLSGKVVASDLSRKWTRWNISANCAEILARPGGIYEIAFGAGNGLTPGTGSGFGNAYTLDATKLTDDDYGQVTPYYTTYFFPNPEVSQALGLDYHRLLASYASIFIDGVGNTSITPLSGSLTNAYPAFPVYPLVASIPYSYEWGMNVTGERIALKIGSVPATGTDNGFTLQDLAMTLKKDPIAPLRGAM